MSTVLSLKPKPNLKDCWGGGFPAEVFTPALPQTSRFTVQLEGTRPGARTPPHPSPASSQVLLAAAASPGLPPKGRSPRLGLGDHREAPGTVRHREKGAFLAEGPSAGVTRAPSSAASGSQL